MKRIAQWMAEKLWFLAVRLFEYSGMPKYRYAVWKD